MPSARELLEQADALMRRNRSAVIDTEIPELTEDFHPENAALFGEHIHPNHRGHRLMAQRVLQIVAARGLLPGVRVLP